ncbi:MAG: alanine racemase, partial [Saprospiraceae bacterium]|nr:alanine racemase [Saprospiraceae bacterium]
RLAQYHALAKTKGWKLKVNLEIDVGLHRGGFADLTSFESALAFLAQNQDTLTLSGLMGYDPHVVKLPKILRSKEKAFEMMCAAYRGYLGFLKDKFPGLWHDQLTLNGAGSPTIALHQSPLSPLNDWSAGSCLVKPSSFDIPSLAGYCPASYIATPVLKKLEGTTIPAIERYKGVLNALDRSNKQSFFIYGGYWKADYHYPFGLKANQLFGESTNQSMVNAPEGSELAVDDFVFLRPKQSEFVFLQFGKILAIRNRQIVEEWDIFKAEND